MKNLIIAGSCRAGKSLLAKEMSKRISTFSYYNTDHIRSALMKAWPESDFDKQDHEKYRIVVKKLYDCFMKYNEIGLYILLEGNHFSLNEFLTLYDDKSTIIVFVGKPQLNESQYFTLVRENEKKYGGWTKHHTDNEVKSFVKEYLQKSREQQVEVEKLNRKDILYLDTSYNQTETIHKFATKLEQLLLED